MPTQSRGLRSSRQSLYDSGTHSGAFLMLMGPISDISPIGPPHFRLRVGGVGPNMARLFAQNFLGDSLQSFAFDLADPLSGEAQ